MKIKVENGYQREHESCVAISPFSPPILVTMTLLMEEWDVMETDKSIKR